MKCKPDATHHLGCACHEVRRDAELAALTKQLETQAENFREQIQFSAKLRAENTELRADLESWKKDRDEWMLKADPEVTRFLGIEEELAKSRAECAVLRGVLEHVSGNRGSLKECCRDAFRDDQLDNHDADIAGQALSASSGEALAAVRGAIRYLSKAIERDEINPIKRNSALAELKRVFGDV